MKTKLEAIRAFRAAGYALIPLCSPTKAHAHAGKPCENNRGKVPVGGAWETTKVDTYNEDAFQENYGVVLGPQDLVVDVDPRNFKAGDQPLRRLTAAIGGFPTSTLVVRTGGGGMHIFLKKPAEVSVRNDLPEYAGVEFKAGPGRQVVGAGSIHGLSGKEYRHLQGSPSEVAAAPEALLALIRRTSTARAFSETGTGAYKDDEATRERAAQYARELAPALQGARGDEATLKAAMGLRDRGLSPKICFDVLLAHYNPRCLPPWEESDLAAKVQHAYAYARGAVGSAHPEVAFKPVSRIDRVAADAAAAGERVKVAEAQDDAVGRSGWKLDNKDQPIRCFQNLLNYFSLPVARLRGVFGYNEFARRVEIIKEVPWGAQSGLPVGDIDLTRMRAHLSREHGYDASKDDLIDAMSESAQRRRFHPVKEYLGGLKWDGRPRLDSWLAKYLGVEGDDMDYVAAAGRKTLVAAVARIYEPGCKFDHVLVLEGRQGLGKSGVCKVLAGEWFSDFKMNVGDKDTVQMMQGKWIVEMPDLHATRQADIDMVKSFLTREVDEARFAYGRLPGRYPRQGIFIGTYNPGPGGTYLKDDENRRWWPVTCHAVVGRGFDFEGLKAVRDQLWAEAVVLYRKGEALKMDTESLQDAALAAQAARRAEHPWQQRVSEWIEERDKNAETRGDFYTGHDVYVGAMGQASARYGRREQLEVARALKDAGWEAGFKRVGGALTRGFWRPGAEMRHKKVASAEALFGDLA